MAADPDSTTRQCGTCNLCCRLLPMHDNEPWRKGVAIDKPAGVRCPHQRHRTGCVIYADRPYCCRVWNCRWLVNDDADDLRRPDHAHYVIDVMPDFITAVDNETGQSHHIEAIQIWCDPRHRDAHRDPALRRWLERRALEGKVALIRYDSRDAITLIPPGMASDGQWHEHAGTSTEKDHTLRDIERALHGRATLKLSQ